MLLELLEIFEKVKNNEKIVENYYLVKNSYIRLSRMPFKNSLAQRGFMIDFLDPKYRKLNWQ